MLRKLALCAVVALVPGIAFAAATGTNGTVSNDTHVTSTESKTDAAVKADVKDSAVKTDVKSDAKGKTVQHRGHKAAAKVKTETKDGKDSSKS